MLTWSGGYGKIKYELVLKVVYWVYYGSQEQMQDSPPCPALASIKKGVDYEI